MAREIAVMVGEQGETAALSDNGKIVIYEKRKGEWSLLREKPFQLIIQQGLGELRAKMGEAVQYLGECRIFVGLSVVGVPYYELEKAGLSIWEFAGRPEEFLDFVLAREEEATLEKAEKQESLPTPVDQGNGRYLADLKTIQQNNSGFTSKQVLLPFLRTGNFYELEVACTHIPPWLEAELFSGGLVSSIESIGPNDIRLTITKKTCL